LNKEITIESLQTQVEDLLKQAEAQGKGGSNTRERKMRWDAGNVNPLIRATELPLDQYGLDHKKLGVQIFDARNARLPSRAENWYELRTMTTGGAATGAELVDVEHFPSLWNDVRLATQVAQLFENVSMDSLTKDLSSLGKGTFLKPATEGAAVTAVDLATSKVTLHAYTLKVTTELSDELDEDSVLALLPALRQQLVLDGAACIDDCLINADATTGTTNINYNGASIATTSRYLLGFDGLLHLPLIDNTGMKSAQTTLASTSFTALLALMGKYGIDPRKVAFVLDMWTYLKAIQLTDVQTYDKMGANATLLSGQLAAIYGIPIVVSEQMAKADSSGLIDGVTPANNDAGRIIAVNRDMWKVGLRRAVTVRAQRDETAGKTAVTATFRLAFVCFGTRASATHTALAYHITV